MMFWKNLLQNRTFIMVFAFVGGLILSDVAEYTGEAILPALILALTVSITRISINDFFPFSQTLHSVFKGLFLTYLLQGGLILILAWWLMPSWDLWVGFVLVAAGPPGIVVIPFTHVLKGNIKISFAGIFGVFFLSIAITPLMVFLFTGGALVSPWRLVYAMSQFILIPVVLVVLLRSVKITPYLEKHKGNIINWCFFIIIFSVVGLNRDLFLNQPLLLARAAFIVFCGTFLLSFFIDFTGKKLSVPRPERYSYMLLATIKTSALSSALGLAFFSEIASVPGAIVTAVYAVYFIFLGIKGNKL